MAFSKQQGFTIVELLIVIVVIAILAAIAIVAYIGVTNRAIEVSLSSDLRGASKQIENSKTTDGSYPLDTSGLKKSNDTILQYNYNNLNATYCVTASSSRLPGKLISVTQGGAILQSGCPGHVINPSKDGDAIQTVSGATCSTGRIRVVDTRDNHTYWVQKLADGKCWMLTNLAYAGGGTNTYSDVKTLTSGARNPGTYTTPSYYVVPSTVNYTTEPAKPSSSTNGSGQYGYLYNWCAAMGGQATGACANSLTPAPNMAISVCPAGWRLPIGNNNINANEFNTLNAAINSGLTNTNAGWRTSWLAQGSGFWYPSTFTATPQDGYGYYWSGSQDSGPGSAFALSLTPTSYSDSGVINKSWAAAVRCMTD